jgi:segregation and condensation protein B
MAPTVRRTKSAKQESAANRSAQEAVEEERLKAILESLLFAAAEPVALAQLVTVLESVARDDVKKALGEMAMAYASGGRGIVLEEVANGYQLRTPREHALYVRKLLAAKPPRLSRPLLETVAIVAYRQPITRPEIEQLRGVDCGGVLDTLVERRLIQIAGRKEAPGRPIMYTTTREFLELFGLKDLSGLPDLEELRLIETPREEALFAKTNSADSIDTSGGAETSEDSAEFAFGGTDAGATATTGDIGTEQPAHPDELVAVEESAAAIASAADASSAEPAELESSSPAADTEDHD